MDIGNAPDTSQKLAAYAGALRASPHNLLSPSALQELEVRHFPESVAFAMHLPTAPRLLDVGSGGGLPGIVIALVRPDIEVHLLEATGKKARFLEETATALGLTTKVHHGRAEELARPPLRGTFDLVTARAVAPIGKLAALCAPYLRPGGRLHAIKGERWPTELEAAASDIAAARLRVVSRPTDCEASKAAHHPMVVVLELTR